MSRHHAKTPSRLPAQRRGPGPWAWAMTALLTFALGVVLLRYRHPDAALSELLLDALWAPACVLAGWFATWGSRRATT